MLWPLQLRTSTQNFLTEYRDNFCRWFPHSRGSFAEKKRYRKLRRRAEWSHQKLWEVQERCITEASTDSELDEDLLSQSSNGQASYRTTEIDKPGGLQHKIDVPKIDIEALQSPDYRIARQPSSNEDSAVGLEELVLYEDKSTQTDLCKEDIEKLIDQQSTVAKHKAAALGHETKERPLTDGIAITTTLPGPKPSRYSRPPFAIYGGGDKELGMTNKRTFNVKADSDKIYESALNAARLKAPNVQMYQRCNCQCHHMHSIPIYPRAIKTQATAISKENRNQIQRRPTKKSTSFYVL